jgi:hypothetical protein
MSHSYWLLQKCSHYRKQEENKKREIERSLSKKNRIQEAILHKDTTSLRFFPSSYRERHVSFLLWTRSVLEFSIYSIKACNTLPFHSVYFPCPLLLYYTHKKKKVLQNGYQGGKFKNPDFWNELAEDNEFYICRFIAPNNPYQIILKYEVMKLLSMIKIYKNPNLFKPKWWYLTIL